MSLWQRPRVDLSANHALYEINYARLQSLLRGAGVAGGLAVLEFAWPREALQLARIDLSRYTETWQLAQATPVLPWCPQLDMTVRLYHDARMAEVLSFQGAARLPAVAVDGRARGWLLNEKQLVNRFLGDCLSHCLQHGLPRDPRLQPLSPREELP